MRSRYSLVRRLINSLVVTALLTAPIAIAGPHAPDASDHSVARLWNEQLLAAIRRDTPRPTVHARNLYHLSAAMYDAWAVHNPDAMTVFDHAMAPPRRGNRIIEQAISHAAYRLLSHRFAASPGHAESQAAFDQLMQTLGFDIHDTRVFGQSPAAVGNRIAANIIEQTLADGANEAGNYADTSAYVPVNPTLIVALSGTSGAADLNFWQPLQIDGLPGPQVFLTPHWGGVTPFAMTDVQAHMPAPPPTFGAGGETELRELVLELIRFSSYLDPSDAVMINISPAVMGNNTLGTQDGAGYDINPYTGEAYDENWVLRGDWSRCLAEFWADGPLSSTPPGHWNEIANQVSDHPLLDKRFGGNGPHLDALEWDIKLYLTLNGALHDSAVMTWGTKRTYDFARPITLIRGMSEYGQSSDPLAPSFDGKGLPLEPGLVEIITPESSAPGQRHAHLSGHVGEIAIRTWLGHPENPQHQFGGVDWILGVEWLPYQQADFVTPPFAGYTSGHSAFSRAAAEVLARFTGSEFFPGGLAEFGITPEPVDGFSLTFEHGPSQPLVLQWATYFDAADEAGISRIYGGIHPSIDDRPGRLLGHFAGVEAFERALVLFSKGH